MRTRKKKGIKWKQAWYKPKTFRAYLKMLAKGEGVKAEVAKAIIDDPALKGKHLDKALINLEDLKQAHVLEEILVDWKEYSKVPNPFDVFRA